MKSTAVLLALVLAACQVESREGGIDMSAAEHAAEACRGFMDEAQYLSCTRRAYRTFKGVEFPSPPAEHTAPIPAQDYSL